jgi:hypothetical protein
MVQTRMAEENGTDEDGCGEWYRRGWLRRMGQTRMVVGNGTDEDGCGEWDR